MPAWLRELLGDSLFARVRRGFTPTPRAEALSRLGVHRRVAFSVPRFSVLPNLQEVDDPVAIAPERFVAGVP